MQILQFLLYFNVIYRVIFLNFEFYDTFDINFISKEQGLYEKPRVNFSLLWHLKKKISKIKICKPSYHESHFAWFLAGLLLTVNQLCTCPSKYRGKHTVIIILLQIVIAFTKNPYLVFEAPKNEVNITNCNI